MFCEKCGFELEEADTYCGKCGSRIGPPAGFKPPRACTRVRDGRRVAGVCMGVATYLRKDVTLVRVIWALAAVIPPVFPGVVAYLVSWLLMPISPAPNAEDPRDAGNQVATD